MVFNTRGKSSLNAFSASNMILKFVILQYVLVKKQKKKKNAMNRKTIPQTLDTIKIIFSITINLILEFQN